MKISLILAALVGITTTKKLEQGSLDEALDYQIDLDGLTDDEYIQLESEYRFEQADLNLTGKQFTAYEAKDQQIPWVGMEKNDTFKLLLERSQLHQPSNVSTINWAGIPDEMISAMKRENKMPGRGINHKVLGTGPWEPHSFEHFSQKFLPNGTEYMFLTGDKQLEENVLMISKEMEKLGVHGAYDAFKMLRPKAFKTNVWRWMALWYYGGIYLDAKIGFTQDTSSWINFKDDEFVLCGARNMYTNDAFLAMTQYHPYGLLMTQAIVNKVNNRFYNDYKDQTTLNITGPEAVRSELIETHQLTWDNVRCYWEKDDEHNKWHVYTADNQNHKDKAQEIMQSDPENDNTYQLMKTCKTCNDYNKLHPKHAVYCDEPGVGGEPETCDGKEWTSFLEPNSWNHMTQFFTNVDIKEQSQKIVREALISKNITKPN